MTDDPTPNSGPVPIALRLLGLGRRRPRVDLAETGRERLAEAHTFGLVVHALPHRSRIDLLTLNVARQLAGLPPAQTADASELALRAAAGTPLVVFLDDPRLEQQLHALGRVAQHQPIALLTAQFVWDRSPDAESPIARFLVGQTPRPSGIRRWWRVWSQRTCAAVFTRGMDLADVRARVRPNAYAKVLPRILSRQLRKEAKTVRGPRLRSRRSMRRLVLDNPPMRAFAREHGQKTGREAHSVRASMHSEFNKIAANFSWWAIRLLEIVLTPLWTRVYSGVDLQPGDADRIRSAMRDGTAILIPCHKSHMDYVLLSWLLYKHQLTVPHIVAGMNLAVWPVSIFLRGAGAFFIRRSLSGHPVSAAVFSRYLLELIRHEYPVEFFIEGGRSRTGHLLHPKLGVLRMVVDAAERRRPGREVTILPIALAYEQVAEERIYAREQSGETKKPETLGQIFKARSVFKRRYGKVYFRVGRPLALSPLVDARDDVPAWSKRSTAEHRDAVQQLGNQVVHEIGRAMVLLPTALVATALLCHTRRAIRHTQLMDRITRHLELLQHCGAEPSASMQPLDASAREALDRFVRNGRIDAQAHNGERVWSVRPDQRVALAFYKNQILHFASAASMVARAIRAASDEGRLADLADPVGRLRRLWRRILVGSPDETDEAWVAGGVAVLTRVGALRCEDDRYKVADRVRMGDVFHLLSPLAEGSAIALRYDGDPRGAKSTVSAVSAFGQHLHERGELVFPESLSQTVLRATVTTLIADKILSAAPQEKPNTEHAEALLRIVQPQRR